MLISCRVQQTEKKIGNYLLDSCAYVGLINTNDEHHTVCEEFFLDHKDDNYYYSLHSFFEAKAVIAKEKRKGNFAPYEPVCWNLHSLPIDKALIKECQRQELFLTFDHLCGADLIFACLAKINGHTLVTCDKQFNQDKEIIDVIYLPK